MFTHTQVVCLLTRAPTACVHATCLLPPRARRKTRACIIHVEGQPHHACLSCMISVPPSSTLLPSLPLFPLFSSTSPFPLTFPFCRPLFPLLPSICPFYVPPFPFTIATLSSPSFLLSFPCSSLSLRDGDSFLSFLPSAYSLFLPFPLCRSLYLYPLSLPSTVSSPLSFRDGYSTSIFFLAHHSPTLSTYPRRAEFYLPNNSSTQESLNFPSPKHLHPLKA